MRWSPTHLPEMRQDLVRQFRQPGHPDEASDAAVYWRSNARRAEDASLWWVSADMGRVALDASTDMPEWTPASVLPAATGLIAFADPMPDVIVYGLPRSLWSTGPDGQPTQPTVPLSAVLWTLDEGLLQLVKVARSEHMNERIPSTGLPSRTVLEPVGAVTGIPSSDPVGPDVWQHSGNGALVAMLGAAWTLMQQSTVASTRRVQPGSKAARRRAGADLGVTVIDLRRMKHIDTAPGTSGRTYRHRWIVRGHWRQQAHGPRQALRRPIWVPSYTKGPVGAPLKTSDYVHVWRR